MSAEVRLGGCNLRCAYCFCPELLGTARSAITVDEIIRRVSDDRQALAGVVITGGEPTAAPVLGELLAALRDLDIPVRIDTNGTYPDVLERLISRELVSFVALDVKTTAPRYDRATGTLDMWKRVHRSIKCVVESRVDHEFRTTCYPSAVATADLPGIARELEGGSRYVLQQFRPQRTFDTAASSVRPYDSEALRNAARCCAVHLPTCVRGV